MPVSADLFWNSLENDVVLKEQLLTSLIAMRNKSGEGAEYTSGLGFLLSFSKKPLLALMWFLSVWEDLRDNLKIKNNIILALSAMRNKIVVQDENTSVLYFLIRHYETRLLTWKWFLTTWDSLEDMELKQKMLLAIIAIRNEHAEIHQNDSGLYYLCGNIETSLLTLQWLTAFWENLKDNFDLKIKILLTLTCIQPEAAGEEQNASGLYWWLATSDTRLLTCKRLLVVWEHLENNSEIKDKILLALIAKRDRATGNSKENSGLYYLLTQADTQLMTWQWFTVKDDS